MPNMTDSTMTARGYTLGLYPHDDTVSVVSVSGHDKGSEYVWITFGEVTVNGFSPCYASIAVKTTDVKTFID